MHLGDQATCETRTGGTLPPPARRPRSLTRWSILISELDQSLRAFILALLAISPSFATYINGARVTSRSPLVAHLILWAIAYLCIYLLLSAATFPLALSRRFLAWNFLGRRQGLLSLAGKYSLYYIKVVIRSFPGRCLLVVYWGWCLIAFPRAWWLAAAAGSSVLVLGKTVFATIWSTWADRRGKSADLSRLVRDLSERVGVEVLWVNIRRGSHPNGWANGLGPLRVVTISRGALETLTPGELSALVLHELAHLRYRHTERRFAVESCLQFVAFLIIALVAIPGVTTRGPLTGVSALPALLLGLFLLDSVAELVLLRLRRQHERAADLLCWQHVEQIGDFVSMLRKIHSNLLEYDSNSQWRFSHPPHEARIEAALRWAELNQRAILPEPANTNVPLATLRN